MARDPEMVRRAQDVWYPWACGDGSGRRCSEMMADFAADEVERQAKCLRGQLSEAEANSNRARASRDTWRVVAETARSGHDAAVARAESAEARAYKAEAAHRATLDLYAKADARADRAETRVRELEAKRAAPPYTPRVGDVVKVVGYEFVFTGPMPGDPVWFGNDTLRGWDLRAEHRDAWSITPDICYLRPATPAERAAAGLPPEPAEAPAAPRVLPEHLAWIEADAAWADSSWSANFDSAENKRRHDAAIVAAKALNAAVARRDGGAK